jgi:DNA-binding response OmpR family regulator
MGDRRHRDRAVSRFGDQILILHDHSITLPRAPACHPAGLSLSKPEQDILVDNHPMIHSITLSDDEEPMGKTIFMLDDENDILQALTAQLEKAGFDPRPFEEPVAFFKALESTVPALIILDLMLPGADGLEICRELRRNKPTANVPIIMLTARDEVPDKVLGLELGADDYLTKPYSRHELIARIKSLLRRTTQGESSIVSAGELRIDFNTYEVRVGDRRVDLTTTEFRLLKMLVERRGWVFNREQILDNLWGKDKIVIDRTVDVHIKNLREKLGAAGEMIKNIRGVGYKLDA